MSGLEIGIGVALLVAITLFSTAIAALQQVSRVRLFEQLEAKGKTDQINRLIAARDEMVFSFSFVRISCILALVLLVDHLFGVKQGPRLSVAAEYGLVFVAGLALTMTFGVAIPNTWARYGGGSFLARALPVLFLLWRVLYPLVALQRVTDGLIRRLAGIPKPNGAQEEAEQIEKEILGVVSEGELAGTVHENEAEMIESVLELRDTSVGEIMTPRTEIVALSASASLAEARELVTRTGHSRIPVYLENLDDIRGVLYAKDLLEVDSNGDVNIADLVRKVPFVPESKRISDLLQELRMQKVHLAIVLDEYGGTAGLVTIEDILEEIVGEISDEYEEPEPDPIRRIDEHTLEVDARVHIDEINDELGIDLPEGDDYDTIGGYVFSTLGKIPVTGEELWQGNVCLRVIDAEERRINRLQVAVVPDKTPA
ncbi:MAG TPA: hemolysin family protein [Phycisphaerae bacterium]|nr:hemolysin family protein [Phycisphaerae bacterium]HOJ75849.1 hemolysin family protein [Phycisphaerae bacterium]HOM53304.1 hemolysin family protein [Phycisphaerae bacterium]HON65923.1 hemolysin family protein [Phycisphaerae bacterium]HPP28429.1 hemolysin family protein [Phycisphaerae bacterium]